MTIGERIAKCRKEKNLSQEFESYVMMYLTRNCSEKIEKNRKTFILFRSKNNYFLSNKISNLLSIKYQFINSIKQ